MIAIPLSAQISALRHIVQRGSPHAFKAGGFAMRNSEGEMLRERLKALLATVEQIEERADASH